MVDCTDDQDLSPISLGARGSDRVEAHPDRLWVSLGLSEGSLDVPRAS